MTQVQLAAACDMPQSTIARIERGTVMPRSATLLQLLDATGHELLVDRAVGATLDREPIRARLQLSVPQRTKRSLRPAATRVLRRLGRFGVRFILIGTVAEAAHGAPHHALRTVAVCCAPDRANQDRLARALETDARPIRLLDEPIPGEGFEVLARTARPMLVDTGLLVRVASLDDLMRIRRARGRHQDRAALEMLAALRDELDGAEATHSTDVG